MPEPIRQSLLDHDLTPRFFPTKAVAASPSAATETVIATLSLSGFGDTSVLSGIDLIGWAAYTVGTSGTAVTLQIKQTNTSGAVVATTGATTATATSLYERVVAGFDAGAGVGTYVLTMTVANGSAPSTVSAVYLRALVV